MLSALLELPGSVAQNALGAGKQSYCSPIRCAEAHFIREIILERAIVNYLLAFQSSFFLQGERVHPSPPPPKCHSLLTLCIMLPWLDAQQQMIFSSCSFQRLEH